MSTVSKSAARFVTFACQMAAPMRCFAVAVSTAKFAPQLSNIPKRLRLSQLAWKCSTREDTWLNARNSNYLLGVGWQVSPPVPVRLTGRSSSGSCWNCSEVLGKADFICRRCESPQQVSHKLNYFEVFNEVQKYDIDANKLQGTFRNLQRLLHPDKFATKSERERALSDGLSAIVNQAYQTLSKPEKRARYLLELSGKDLDSVVLDSAFLGRMMELNEEVDLIEKQKNQKCAAKYLNVVQSEAELVTKQLEVAFEKDSLDQASVELAKLKYLRNVETKLKEVLGQ